MNKLKRKNRNRILSVLSVILILCGIILIIQPFLQVKFCNDNENKNIKQWDKKIIEIKKNNEEKDEEKNEGKNKFSLVSINGRSMIGKIIVPKINKKFPIIKGATKVNLKHGAVLYENGVYPGEKGSAIILGHRDTTFSFLQNIEIGDEIYIESLNGIVKFKVYNTYITMPEDKSMFNQSKETELTLITCYPFMYLGNAPKRFVVNLKLIK